MSYGDHAKNPYKPAIAFWAAAIVVAIGVAVALRLSSPAGGSSRNAYIASSTDAYSAPLATSTLNSIASAPQSHQSISALAKSVYTRLPQGDTSPAQCQQLLQDENLHANTVFVPSGPNLFVESILDHKYVASKRLCLAEIERIQRFPAESYKNEDIFITDLAKENYVISEISIDMTANSKPQVWYFDKPTYNPALVPSAIWKIIRSYQ